MVKNESYDESIDVWALGVLTYELITKCSPFSSAYKRNDEEVIKRISSANFIIPSNLREESKEFIKYLLQKDPTKRPSLREIFFHPFIRKYYKPTKEQEEPFEKINSHANNEI